jgi:hypothetical protein
LEFGYSATPVERKHYWPKCITYNHTKNYDTFFDMNTGWQQTICTPLQADGRIAAYESFVVRLEAPCPCLLQGRGSQWPQQWPT